MILLRHADVSARRSFFILMMMCICMKQPQMNALFVVFVAWAILTAVFYFLYLKKKCWVTGQEKYERR